MQNIQKFWEKKVVSKFQQESLSQEQQQWDDTSLI